MSAGRMAAPMKTTYRGSINANEGTIPSRAPVTTDAKHAAIVLTRIGIRSGDNTDILEALGLIPTVYSPTSRNAPTACADCEWVSSKPTNPALALLIHRRAKHTAVTA